MLFGSFILILLGCLGAASLVVVVLVVWGLVGEAMGSSRHGTAGWVIGLALSPGILLVGMVMGLVFVLLLSFPLLLLTLAAVMTAEIVVKRRTARQHALLWSLTNASERLIPLVPAVEAFAQESRGYFAKQARTLAGMLSSGISLPDALEETPELVPAGTLPMIRVGHDSGALAPALRQAVSVRDSQRPVWMGTIGRLAYLAVLASFGVYILGFIMLKVVPAFSKIFDDFGTDLPPLTTQVITAAHLVMVHWYILAPVLSAIGLLFLYGLLCYYGAIAFDLPGTRRLLRRLDTAALLETLALAAGQQRPLGEAIATLARSYPKRSIRDRLDQVVRDLEGGRPWCESLAGRGLIGRADRAILEAAQRVGNLPWAMREMADSNRRRLTYRIHAAVQLLFPPCILLLGAIVMCVVVGFFLPLIPLVMEQAIP